ncbi:MAG TPA: sulfotransferase [Rhizomicrobium sp.]|jgi:tetratricopeptide (TPR) repeat protein
MSESPARERETAAGGEPKGSLATALAHAARLLETDPALAEAQAREILNVVPGQPEALLLLATALGRQGQMVAARSILGPLAKSQTNAAAVQLELGLVLADLGETTQAIAALARAVQLDPKLASGWRALGDQWTLLGDAAAADQAYARSIQASVSDPQLLEAAAALCEGRLAIAERLLRDALNRHPTDVAAIRMLAETGTRLGRYEDAEHLLERCLELAPSFAPARHNYAVVLYRQNKTAEALKQIDKLLETDARNPGYRALKAAALGQVGEYRRAVVYYESLLKDFPQHPKAWMSYGHTLKTLGRTKEGIAAYRKSIALLPHLGESYWSLANLKTFRFDAADVAAMQGQLQRSDLSVEDRLHLNFALGKALEDSGDYAESFANYDRANALRREQIGYDGEEISALARQAKAQFTAKFFAERAGFGCKAPDPIFIVGLPRSGSTLLEQILSSHSMVEGTMELPDIIAIAKRLGGRKKRDDASAYPAVLETLGRDDCRALGEEYLDRTRVHRKKALPFFIDKMPNNFLHLGLIHLILPNARIIDARRHPLACCLSNFKQHFARGQGFAYSLSDLGRYYANYVEMMAHFDAVLPGRIHRVFYERMVDDPESEIGALLAHCGLPFEPQCLRFHETERPVRTASSEQVRLPIFSDGLENWRPFEPWLGDLKAALGPLLSSYPAVPETTHSP